MKAGDFVLSKSRNGLNHNIWCICQLNHDLSSVKTVSFPLAYREYAIRPTLTCLDNYPVLKEYAIPITLTNPEFLKIIAEKHIIRKDSLEEFKVFIQNLIQQKLKEVS